MEFNGANCLDAPRINHASNAKNLVKFKREYSDRVGPAILHYVDTNTGAAIAKYTYKEVERQKNSGAGGAYAAGCVLGVDNTDNSDGFAKRQKIFQPSTSAAPINVIMPLNRFGFFESFVSEISPNGKVSIDVTLESDDKKASAEGRHITKRFLLWVSKMIFKARGKQTILHNYLKPQTWSYMKDRVEISSATQQ